MKFLVEKREFENNYANVNPSIFTNGMNPTNNESVFDFVAVGDDGSQVLIVSNEKESVVKKHFKTAKETKKTITISNPKSFGGNVELAEEWLKNKTKQTTETDK